MFDWLKPRRAPPRIPEGRRVYAIGDIHGRLDLFVELLDRIEVDNARRPPASIDVVLLGDIIDRGPQSAQMVDMLMGLQNDLATLHVLKGNHESAMVEALSGNPGAMGRWIANGGDAALRSWGIGEDLIDVADPAALRAALAAAVPAPVAAWLDGLPLSYRVGDYLFVHAGIRPGIPLDDQNPIDLMWIRADFLDSRADHGVMVVHGHTIRPEVETRRNRIGIDTGAYRTGKLTALGLEGASRWVLST